MKTSHVRGALLTAIVVLAQASCGGRAGEQQSDEASSAGAQGSGCLAGDTRECVGPGACRGGQQCRIDGLWGSCDCGTTGGTAQTRATGGASGGVSGTSVRATGGQATGGRGSGGTGVGAAVAAGAPSIGGGMVAGRTGILGGAGTTAAGGLGQGGSTGKGGSPISSGGYGRAGAGSGGLTVGGAPFTGGTGGTGTAGAFSGGTTNHPPQIVSLTFSHSAPGTDSTIVVYPSATDPEFDSISYTYQWTRNNLPVGWNSSQLSGSLYFSKGDELRVTVTPSDGKSSGDPVTSQAIVVANTPPEFYSWPTVSPDSYADDNTDLTCSATATDPDGDSIVYKYDWYESDTLTSYHEVTLPASATSTGQRWACHVSATDGGSGAADGRSSATLIAQTASGIYRTDTTWLASKSPYIVTGRIQIAAGATLKVEPGVSVIGSGYSLESWGSVSMQGTREKPIRVEDLNTFDNSTIQVPGKFTLSFVEYIRGGLLSSGNGALVSVSDCVLRDIGNQIVLASGLSVSHRFERNLLAGCCGIMAIGPLILNGNTFTATNSSCTDVSAQDSLVGSSNSFDPYTEYVIFVGPKSVDLRNNYWGGLSDSEIPGRIFDNNDDLFISGVAQFLPTLAAPSSDAPPIGLTYFP